MYEENYPEHAAKSLVKVIQKASAIDPKSRYSDIKIMISELNAIIADREYNKTMFMNSHESSAEDTRTVLVENKKHRKRIKLIIIAVLACIIALAIFLALIMNNKASDKKASETTIALKQLKKLNQRYNPQMNQRYNLQMNQRHNLKRKSRNRKLLLMGF